MLDSKINESFNTSLLQCLHSKRHLELLDVVDSLRAQGLNDHVDLPQLIVCGDQSSGKSSVLAAISGVPFPKRDNLCTRFATEVILRRNDDVDTVQISASITTGGFKLSGYQAMASSFHHDLESMDQLPEILEKAAIAMGVGTTGSAFSSSILRLEVRGPYMPQLTIVDLPGLIHSENKYQSAEDIELVTELVGHYMAQERSIILAVVSAKNDYANQIVLTKARKVDPEGKRTLGIITKPDTLYPGSASESSFLSLAKNQDVRFSLGWHVVRNQDSNQIIEGDRDQVEMSFFETTRWSGLAEPNRGISTLRHRLSEVLFEQITKELPAMISEILKSIEDSKAELTRMGRSRSTDLEKRLFMMELAQNFSNRSHAACEALYDHPFFADQDLANTQPRRLRAIIQNANMAFAEKMLALPLRVRPMTRSVSKDPASISAKDHVARAKELIISHRGKELPGTFNPLLIGPLFREMSLPWLPDARSHIEDMWIVTRTTTLAILGDITEVNVADKCVDIIIGPKLEDMRSVLMERLDTYMHEYQRQPITYNHYLTENVQAVRMRRRREEALAGCRKILNQHGSIELHDVELLVSAVVGEHQPGMDDLAAQDLADYAKAYYEVALKRVIDEVAAHVIEPVIFLHLPKLLDSSEILKMPQADIDSIAEESDARKTHRQLLQSKLDVLSRSSLLCKLYLENGGALPHSNIMQQLDEQISSNGRTPSNDSDALHVNIQQNEGLEPTPGNQEEASFDGLGAVVSEPPAVENAFEEDMWDPPTRPKKSKKGKKTVASSYPEEPAEPWT